MISDSDDLLLTGGRVEIAAAGKPPTVTILTYSGNLLKVPGWGPAMIDLAGLDLSACQVGILADYDATLKGIIGHGRAQVRDGKRALQQRPANRECAEELGVAGDRAAPVER